MPQHPLRRRSAARPLVLLVQDDQRARGDLSRILRREGFEVFATGQGVAAHWCLERHADRVALVVTDLLPPAPDGYHLGIAFGRVHPRIPLLFTSPRTRDESIRLGLLHPAAPYLQHPCPPATFARAVHRLLARWRVPPAA